MNDEIPDFELKEWKQHPFTQRFFQFLFFRREQNKEDWAKGMLQGEDLQEWALKNAKALGGVDALDQLLSIEMTDILQAETEGHEYIRNQSRRLDGSSKTNAD